MRDSALLGACRSAARPRSAHHPGQGRGAVSARAQHRQQRRTAQSHHLRGILLEFGIAIPQGFAALLRTLPKLLEDGDNELPDFYRPTLHRMYQRMLELREDIGAMTKEVSELVKNHAVCSRLTAIEGIGPIGAMSLYSTLGSGAAFSKAGRPLPTSVSRRGNTAAAARPTLWA